MINKINLLHEKRLRIVYSDKTSSFKELLEKDGSISIHIRNLQVFVTKTFRIYKVLSRAVITNIFHIRQNNYNLRHS